MPSWRRGRRESSWNTGVNYEKQLENSVDFAEVKALDADAGLSLDADLATLSTAPRISAAQGAVDYLTQNVVFDGPGRQAVLNTAAPSFLDFDPTPFLRPYDLGAH